MGHGKVFLPVVHLYDDAEHNLASATAAFNGGADGVFLIDHNEEPGSYAKRLLYNYAQIREHHQHRWIGLNFLGYPLTEAYTRLPRDANGLWADNAGIVERDNVIHTSTAETFKHFRSVRTCGNNVVYFGGVAFKGQRPVTNLKAVVESAAPLVDIITTSGTSTGLPPSLEKVAQMHSFLPPETPLALASGITPENVRQYREFADCFLVSSSLVDDNDRIIEARVREFAHMLKH